MLPTMKLKIDNDVLVEEFFQDTRLLGIVAPIKDYRFCWHLNQILQFDFRINNGIEIQLNKKRRTYFFSIYEHVEKVKQILSEQGIDFIKPIGRFIKAEQKIILVN